MYSQRRRASDDRGGCRVYEKKANAQNKKRRTATRGRDYRRLCFVSLQVSSLPLYKALTSYGGSHPRKKPLSTRTGERSRERTQAISSRLSLSLSPQASCPAHVHTSPPPLLRAYFLCFGSSLVMLPPFRSVRPSFRPPLPAFPFRLFGGFPLSLLFLFRKKIARSQWAARLAS